MKKNDSYIKDPKGSKGHKHGPSEQDQDDFAQEKLIQEWLKQESRTDEFVFEHISRKGTARNTLVRAQVRLDAQIRDDGTGTFADIIAGCDGRDLYSGVEPTYLEPEPLEEIYEYLFALGFNQGEIECLVKMLKLSIQENKSLFEKSAIDSEW